MKTTEHAAMSLFQQIMSNVDDLHAHIISTDCFHERQRRTWDAIARNPEVERAVLAKIRKLGQVKP